MQKNNESDAILTDSEERIRRGTMALVEIFNEALWKLPTGIQRMVDTMLKAGTGHAGLVVTLTPTPEFIGVLLTGPDTTPVELFRVKPAFDTAPTAQTVQKEQTH